jgi:phosphoesterase RecJ-like protein
MEKTNNTFSEIWEAMLGGKSPICCIDSRPDFDAFCSALGLKEVLAKHGIDLKLTWHNDVPKYVKEILDTRDIQENIDPKDVDFSKYDLLIMLDCGTSTHLSPDSDFEIPQNIKVINIDHHASNEYYGNLNYVDPEAASACLLLHRMIKNLDIPVDASTAKALMLGILQDSGQFHYKATKPEDLRAVADLMEKGADLFGTLWEMSFNISLDTMKLRGLTYTNLKVNKEKAYAYTTITKEEILRENIDINEALKPSDSIKQLKDIRFIFAIREDMDTPGQYNVSFRSHDPSYDVSILAKKLEGGGHKPAAGGVIRDATNMEEALDKVLEAIEEVESA